MHGVEGRRIGPNPVFVRQIVGGHEVHVLRQDDDALDVELTDQFPHCDISDLDGAEDVDLLLLQSVPALGEHPVENLDAIRLKTCSQSQIGGNGFLRTLARARRSDPGGKAHVRHDRIQAVPRQPGPDALHRRVSAETEHLARLPVEVGAVDHDGTTRKVHTHTTTPRTCLLTASCPGTRLEDFTDRRLQAGTAAQAMA